MKPSLDGVGKPLLVPQITAWRVFAAFAVYVAVATVVFVRLVVDGQPSSLRVVGSFWASGEAASAGLNPYLAYPLTWTVELAGPDIVDLNLNPPTLLPLFQLFALFDPYAIARAVPIVSAIAYCAGIAALIRKLKPSRLQIAWAMMLPALHDTLALKQIYVIMFLLSLAALLAVRAGQKVAPGLLLGVLIAIKPNFALLVPIVLAAGHWRLALAAIGAGAALAAIPAGVYGVDIYAQWLAAAAGDQHWIFPSEASIAGYFSRLGVRGAGQVIAAGVLGASAWLAWKQRLSAERAVALGLTAAIACSPLAWYHYSLALVPAILSRKWGVLEWAAAGLLFVPLSVPLAGLRAEADPIAGAIFGAVYVAGFLFYLASLVTAAGRPWPQGAEPSSVFVRTSNKVKNEPS